MKISVIGAGYVGLALAFAYNAFGFEQTIVHFYDSNFERCTEIEQGVCPLGSDSIKNVFKGLWESGCIHADYDLLSAVKDASYVFICVPTPLNEKTKLLDSSIVFDVLKELDQAFKNEKSPQIFIRSTINPSDCKVIKKKFPKLRVHCFPEFLREKSFIEDVLQPSRIVVGTDDESVDEFIKDYLVHVSCSPEVLITSNEEAMAIKVLSNSYLATRVAFFNEVDSYAKANGLDSSKIIHGMGLDPRIGDYYNQPSEGYGGKCLPKDLQASATMMVQSGVKPTILETVHLSNEARKKRGK